MKYLNKYNEGIFSSKKIDKKLISDIKKYLEDNYQNVQFDENNNDKWDEGNYDLKIFPEPIVLLKNFITIKPNWDTNGVEIYMD